MHEFNLALKFSKIYPSGPLRNTFTLCSLKFSILASIQRCIDILTAYLRSKHDLPTPLLPMSNSLKRKSLLKIAYLEILELQRGLYKLLNYAFSYYSWLFAIIFSFVLFSKAVIICFELLILIIFV